VILDAPASRSLSTGTCLSLDVNPASRRPAWQQAADVLRDAITCALLREHLDAIRAELGVLGLKLPEDA
jgi:hypothetical protein